MAKKGDRLLITLQCGSCSDRNYHSEKSRRNDPQRLEQTKYCPRCRSRSLHREVR